MADPGANFLAGFEVGLSIPKSFEEQRRLVEERESRTQAKMVMQSMGQELAESQARHTSAVQRWQEVNDRHQAGNVSEEIRVEAEQAVMRAFTAHMMRSNDIVMQAIAASGGHPLVVESATPIIEQTRWVTEQIGKSVGEMQDQKVQMRDLALREEAGRFEIEAGRTELRRSGETHDLAMEKDRFALGEAKKAAERADRQNKLADRTTLLERLSQFKAKVVQGREAGFSDQQMADALGVEVGSIRELENRFSAFDEEERKKLKAMHTRKEELERKLAAGTANPDEVDLIKVLTRKIDHAERVAAKTEIQKLQDEEVSRRSWPGRTVIAIRDWALTTRDIAKDLVGVDFFSGEEGALPPYIGDIEREVAREQAQAEKKPPVMHSIGRPTDPDY